MIPGFVKKFAIIMIIIIAVIVFLIVFIIILTFNVINQRLFIVIISFNIKRIINSFNWFAIIFLQINFIKSFIKIIAVIIKKFNFNFESFHYSYYYILLLTEFLMVPIIKIIEIKAVKVTIN